MGTYYGNCLGSFQSPNYPSNYESTDSCIWVIKVKIGFRVELKFTHFDLEDCGSCKCDSVTVRDGRLPGANVIGKYCGQEKPKTIVSSGRYLMVKLDSDSATTKKGFAATYTAFATGKQCRQSTAQTGNKTSDRETTPDGTSDTGNNWGRILKLKKITRIRKNNKYDLEGKVIHLLL